MSFVLKIENVSKMYRLGVINSTTLSDDIKRLWYKFKGKEDPFLKIGQENTRSEYALEDYVWALNNINLKIKQGEIVGIIGRNGAGKSTLLKLLSKVTKPTKGRIISRGKTSSLLEVGTGFHNELTGRENIFLNGAILGMTKLEITSKIDDIIEFSGCERYIDTPVKRYSSGMFVRLAFAVAAHLEPDILIVDEVLAVGDAEFQKKAIGKMQEISKKGGRTVLFVSHNMTSIKALCNRAVLLENGKLIKDGSPNSIIRYYLNNSTKISHEKSWLTEERPRNSNFELLRVWLSNVNKKVVNNINIDMDFKVNIDFNVIKDFSKVGLNVILHDENQNIISTSINNHEKFFYCTKMKIGNYTSSCKIPSLLFNSGIYFVSIYIFGENFSDTKMIEYILKFELEEGIVVRGDYHGKYKGVLRPMLEWETHKI